MDDHQDIYNAVLVMVAQYCDGRFADRLESPRTGGMGDTYYPVRLVASFPLRDLPDSETFERETDPPEDDDE